MELSVLGMGGFHQVEVSLEEINGVLDRYLAAGGNYVETAAGYGKGASERKLGRALEGRHDQVRLASKTVGRDGETVWRQLNESLERLGAKRLDVYFFHGVGTMADLDAVCAPGGAIEAFDRAKREGLVRYFGLTSHWPPVYFEALKRLPLDVVMVWGNYLDFCNYPEISRDLIPYARKWGAGVMLMKPLADGYLYRSPRPALRFAAAQNVDCVVAGFNSVEQLEADLAALCDPAPVMTEELERCLAEAPELGDYVCRQCVPCPICDKGDMVKKVFELEGKYDRQMDDRRSTDAAHYALRMRLKHWFGNQERAQTMYREMGEPALALAEAVNAPCPFGIDVPRKLCIAHAKLGELGDVNLL